MNPAVAFGKPVIKGTRIPAALVVANLAGGMSHEELIAEYDLTEEAIRAALGYAASVLASEEVRATS